MNPTGYTDSGDPAPATNPVAATLRAARAQIADPARWTQREFARDPDGQSIGPRSPHAVCWCAAGAIEAATTVGQIPELAGALNALLAALNLDMDPLLPDGPLWTYNDAPTTTHADVLALFDRAIAAAEHEAP